MSAVAIALLMILGAILFCVCTLVVMGCVGALRDAEAKKR